jgi:hypothetical protein
MDDMTPAKQDALASIRTLTNDLVSVFDSEDVNGIKLYGPKTSFYEKLMLLDSATLTLLFTVVSGVANQVHRNNIPVVGIVYFKVGCWMLAVSIICCLMHNYLNIAAMKSFFQFKLGTRIRMLVSRINRAVEALGHEQVIPMSTDQANKENKKFSRRSKLLEYCCHCVGFVAQIATVTAFVCLVIFINSNISSIL